MPDDHVLPLSLGTWNCAKLAHIPRRFSKVLTGPKQFSLRVLLLILTISLAGSAMYAESCQGGDDMDAATRNALETTAKRYFDMASKGDAAGLRQNSIPSLASGFGSVETAVSDNQANFAGAQATVKSSYSLKEDSTAPTERAEFLCGVFGKTGQTAGSAVFMIPNLPAGNYGIVSLDVAGNKIPYTVSFVLVQDGAAWKLGGFYARSATVSGHDAKWFLQQARTHKTQGKNHNAWFYYLQARELMTPVNFMSTLETDKLYDEAEAVKPADLPTSGNGPTDLAAANGKTYKLTALFPLTVGNDLDLVVKYQAADVSNTGQTFQENSAVIKALVAKYPEFRDAFAGVVARAVDPSGRDYGSLLQMKDVK